MEAVLGLAIIVGVIWLLLRAKGGGGSTAPRKASGSKSKAKDYASPDEPSGREELSTDGKQSVVGESNYQPALKAAAGGRVVARDDFDAAVHAEAVLVPEPRNPYDVNAVRVQINGQKVGYLPREDAADYRPALDRLWQDGTLATCPARIMGGGKRPYGIFLHLARPERARRANTADGIEVVDCDRTVAVSRSRDHIDVIERAVGGLDPDEFGQYPPLVCQLVEGVVSRGKYEGEPSIEVRLDGQRIGELTQTMTDRYWHLLADGSWVGCEVVICREEDGGLDVKAKLPAVSA